MTDKHSWNSIDVFIGDRKIEPIGPVDIGEARPSMVEIEIMVQHDDGLYRYSGLVLRERVES